MKIFETEINIPIGSYKYQASIAKPRIPTRFEEIAVFAIDYFQKLNNSGFLNISLKCLFTQILQLSGIDDFLEKTVEDLFSSSYDLLRTKNHYTRKLDLTIKEIEITKTGRLLLEQNKMPAVPILEKGTFSYDFIREKMTDKKTAQEDLSLPSLQYAPFANMRMEEVLKGSIISHTKEKDVIVNVSKIEEPEFACILEKIFLSTDEQGKISIKSKVPELENYIRQLPDDVVENDILRRIFGKPDPTLETVDFETAYATFDPISSTGQIMKVPVAVHNCDSISSRIKPRLLEVVISDPKSYAAFVPPSGQDDEIPARLLMPNPFSGEMNGEFDGTYYYAKYNIRFHLNSREVLLPVYVSYKPEKDEADAFNDAIFANAFSQENENIYQYLFLTAVRPQHFADSVAKALKSDDFHSIIKECVQMLKKWKMEDKIPYVCDAIVPDNLLTDINGMEKTAGIIKGFRVAAPDIYNVVASKLKNLLDQYQPAVIDEAASFVKAKQLLSVPFTERDFEKTSNVLKRYEKSDVESFVLAIDKIAGQEIKLRNYLKKLSSSCLAVPKKLHELCNFVKLCRKHSFLLPGIEISSDIAEEIMLEGMISEDERNYLSFLPYVESLFALKDVLSNICLFLNIKDIYQFTGFKDKNIDFGLLRGLISKWDKSFAMCQDVLRSAYGCADILSFIEKIKKDFSAIKCYYVFDTCSLVNCPEILRFAGNNNVFIIPKIVIEELDHLKDKIEDGHKARAAIKGINSMEGKNITISESCPQLLSADYDKDNNDNLILSTALQYKKNNMSFVTDDINLANKAKGEDINTLNSKECIKELSVRRGNI